MALTTKNVNLKAQILDTVNSVSKDHVKPKILAPGKYAIDIEPIVPRLKNNREAHLNYHRHLKEKLEAEVAQNVADRKHDKIKQKYLLIGNDNLIVECLSKEVFSIATNSELYVARFTKMHVANTIVKARCLELKAELSNCDKSHNDNHDELVNHFFNLEVFSVAINFELNVARLAKMHVANTSVEARCLALEAGLATLRDKSHQENQGELIKHFSKLEVEHLNLQLKYQNLKDSIGNNPPTPNKDTPGFDSVFVIGKMQASLQGKDNAIRQLKKKLSKFQVTSSDIERTVKVRTIDSQLTKVTDPVTNLQEQNDLLRAENDKVKQHYKEFKAKVQPPVLTRTMHVVDVEQIVPRLRNNRDAHLDYLRHLKESVETIRNIVEEAKVVRPLDRSIVSACRYTKHSQELLEYAIGTCPQGVTSYPKASGSQPKSNPKTNRIPLAKGANKLPVEDLPRTNKSHLKTTNHVNSSSRLKRTVINSNSDFICQTCNKCLTSFDHDMCVAVYVKSFVIPHSTHHNCEVERKIKQVWKPKHVERKIKQVWKPKHVEQKMKQVWKPKPVAQVWKPTCKILTTIGHQWRPTGQILHLGKQCPLTRVTPPKVVSAKQSKKRARTCANQMEPNHN
nr:hypothetical protein [Tanacetum cinerariifolium]